ncbi:MAG: class I SAM-dependent methyltransferase [Candidatus Hadarchaeales archaeon]
MARYDETAHIYERRYSGIQVDKYRAIEKWLPEKCGLALDLGCGSGLFFDWLIRRARVVVGLDISREMLGLARRRGNVFLVRGDAENLPFADGVFDLVLSMTVLQNLPSPGRAVREVGRVLKEGGVSVITSLRKKHRFSQIEQWVKLAGMRPVKSGEIAGSEDDFCVAVK